MDNYRKFLNNQYAERLERNPHYSLRSFARDIGISSGRLSEVLRGKQGLSRTSAESIACHLELDPQTAQEFVLQTVFESGRKTAEREFAKVKLAQLAHNAEVEIVNDNDLLEMIGHWWNFALLELVETKGFCADPKWIAHKLGISQREVRNSIERLIRLKYLRRNSAGDLRCIKSKTRMMSPPTGRSEAIRRAHIELLAKARAMLAYENPGDRDISNLIFSIKRDNLPKFKARLASLRREFAQIGDIEKEKEVVYCLCMQLLPLSR